MSCPPCLSKVAMSDGGVVHEGIMRARLGLAAIPYNINARLAPFAATEPGIAGLETLLPLVCQLAADNVADLPTLLDCVTQHPARILGECTMDINGG